MKIFLSLAVSVLCLYFATRNVQWAELKRILSEAKIMPILLSMSVSLASFWMRAIRWQKILKPFQIIAPATLLRWQVGGLLINNLLPLRMGELARAYWAGHKSSISKSTMLATIFLERLLDIVSIATLAFLFLFLLGMNPTIQKRITPIQITLTVASLSVLFLIFKRYLTPKPKEKVVAILKKILSERLYTFVKKFLEGLSIFKDGSGLVRILFLSLLVWCTDILVIQVMSRSLGLNLSWLQSGLVVVGLVLGVMVPAAPGAAGTYEAGGVAALSLLGVDSTLAFSFILLLHSAQYIFVLLMGIPMLLYEGINLRELFRNLKSENE
ncbi:MAG: flippase-like domain-containing protein [Elusimicrobia bacterium]|nr:flippase-like domain-containing protein [Elusimicrobiota bacterium]